MKACVRHTMNYRFAAHGLIGSATAIALGVIGLTASSAATDAAGPVGRPNFVFILGEGHGWTSTSVQMDDAAPDSKSSFVRTPNLEKLAAAGMQVRQLLRAVAALHALAGRHFHRQESGAVAHDVHWRGQEGQRRA